MEVLEESKKKLMIIKIVSLNVRSAESDIKREILQKFIREQCMDRKVLAFNETHLKEPMQCRGWNVNQGQCDKKGGVWTAVKPNQFKNIMHYKSNICWTMLT